MAAARSLTGVATEVACVLQDVLVHQRARWGTLVGHQRQFEGWWKAEFALALESWCWTFSNRPTATTYGVIVEPKPSWCGFGDSKMAADLLVAPWSDEKGSADYESGPRVWIEIKERADWWPDAKKALGTANAGLWKDLYKWNDVFKEEHRDTDIVLACHILTYRGGWKGLPSDWADAFQEVKDDGFEPFVEPRVVGIELPPPRISTPEDGQRAGEGHYLWARLDLFRAFPK